MIRFVRKPERWEHVKMLQSGKNSLIQCNYCDKQFWKLFSFFATIFIYTTLLQLQSSGTLA